MNCTRKVSFAFCGLLAMAAAFVASSAFAQAACPQWDVNGNWTLIQTNNTAANLWLTQTPNGFSGNATFGYWVEDDFWLCNIGSCGKDYVIVSGPVVGTVKGDVFEATVHWSDNAIGVYTGRIGAQGLIVGSGYNQRDPSTTADWHSNRFATCASAAPPPTAKPTLALGRVRMPAGTPASPPRTMCEMARSAREANRPTATALEQRCKAELAARPAASVSAAVPVAGPASAPPASSSPVPRPQDLLIGLITYSVDGQNAGRLEVGKPVTIVCNYIVNEVEGLFVPKIQLWQGNAPSAL